MLQTVYQYISLQDLMWSIVLFPLIGAVVNGLYALLSARFGFKTSNLISALISCGLPILSFVAVLICFVTLIGFPEPTAITGPLFQWTLFDDFVIHAELKLDQLSLIMGLVVTGVGSLIHVYSIGYMSHDEGFARYFSYLNLFLFFMLMLVLGSNMLLLFVGWEGVGLCSYLLIGFWFEDPKKASAGKKAFVVNRIGDAGFLLGMFLIYSTLHSLNVVTNGDYLGFETLRMNAPYLLPMATPICLLLFLGACGKSAQIPLYVWLPDAMAGPTPVSALIHAATMVTAGVYMVSRLSFLYVLSPVAMQTVAIVGAITAIFAATIGLLQNDIKKVLAYSTISQLGYMFLGAGVGAFTAAIFHLMTHAFFKACLFLGSGSVIHAMHGEQDIRKYGNLKEKMPITTWTFVIASAAIAGIFPLSGFFSKDAILWNAYHNGHIVLWILGFVGAGLTAFYMFRLVGMTFFGETNVAKKDWKNVHESPPSMTAVLITLAILSIAGGWIGIPKAMGGLDHFHEWLKPALAVAVAHEEGSHTEELILAVLSFLWVLHFVIIAWVIYTQKRDWPDSIMNKAKALYTLVYNKYFVDEFYNIAIIRPIRFISEKFLWKIFDATVIDGGMVHGTGRLIVMWNRALSRIQNGIIQQYLAFFLVGVILILWMLLY